MADGPTAYNRADLVSVFPAGLTAAASWDEDLIYQRALALGSEFRDKGSHVGLAYDSHPFFLFFLADNNNAALLVDLLGDILLVAVIGKVFRPILT